MKKATFVLSLIVVLALLVPAAGAQTYGLTKTLSTVTPAVGDTFTVSLTVDTTAATSSGYLLRITDQNPNPDALQIVAATLPDDAMVDGSGNFVWEAALDPTSIPSFTIVYEMQVTAYAPGILDGLASLIYVESGEVIGEANAPFNIALNNGDSASFPAPSGAAGVDVTVVSGGPVVVTVAQTEGAQCTTNSMDGAVLHCYDITVVPADACLTVTFNYDVDTEANGNTAPQVWHWNGAGWDQIVPTVSVAGSVTALVCGFSPFALADVQPTAITLEAFAASGSAPLALLAVAVVALTVLGLALRRRSA
ncbi:MAG: hypothetical protein JW850_10345 [Thermoflexales bacterium]|nr:hypothetical protein [Thermoflexales bacterium]